MKNKSRGRRSSVDPAAFRLCQLETEAGRLRQRYVAKEKTRLLSNNHACRLMTELLLTREYDSRFESLMGLTGLV